MKILITGSSGMIGTALCEKLSELRIPFIGLDKRHNFYKEDIDVVTIIHDLLIRDITSICKLLENHKFDMIIHLAANARVWKLIQDTTLAVDNVEMTNNVYRIADRLGIKKVIIASSREVYGDLLGTDVVVAKETDAIHTNSESQYTASKICGESLANAYNVTHGIKTLITRFSNVYGRYDDSDRFIPLLIKKILEKQDIVIFGGRNKKMDFTFIDDSISGLLILVQKFDSINKSEIFNISTGIASSLYTVAEILRRQLDSKVKIDELPNRLGEIMYYAADVSKISKLGYSPSVSIESGIIKSINYYKEYYATQRKSVS